MSAPARADTLKAATVILSMGTENCAADERKRLLLLPHVDSLLRYDGTEYALSFVEDMGEWYRAISRFHSAYLEGAQYQKVSQFSS